MKKKIIRFLNLIFVPLNYQVNQIKSNQIKFNLKMETLTITTEQKISQIGLIEILNNVSRGTFVHLITETLVRMNKKNNPYYNQVIKRSSRNYLLGNSYEDRKNNNLEKKGEERNFEASYNRVGKHVSKCVLFNENTGKFYLQLERFKEKFNLKVDGKLVKYLPIKNEFFFEGKDGNLIKIPPIKNSFFFEGKEIDIEKIEPFIKVSTNEEIDFISVSVDNIKEITLNKNKYIIEGVI